MHDNLVRFFSQFILVLLLTRVTYLIFAKQMTHSLMADQIVCKSIPYLIATFQNISIWLMTSVTVERALASTWSIRSRLFHTPRLPKLVSTATLVLLFGSLYSLIIEYKIVLRSDQSFSSEFHRWYHGDYLWYKVKYPYRLYVRSNNPCVKINNPSNRVIVLRS